MFRRSLKATLIAPALAAALLGAALVVTMPASAQPSTDPIGEHPSQRLISIDFGGGTTSDFYNALQDALGQHVVVILPGAEDVTMPPVKLTNVPFGEAVRVARYVRNPVILGVESEGQTWIVYPISDGPRSDSSLRTETWSLAEHLALNVSPDALLSAVQAGLDLAGSGVELKYHDETHILFARGIGADLEIIDDTLDRTRDAAWTLARKQTTPDIDERVALLEQQLADLKTSIDALAR